MPTHNDLLLGQISIRKGLVTIEQLMEALQEQAKDTPPGEVTVRIRRYQRPLGVILVARGFLTDAQLLSLLQEQKARLQLPADYLDVPREQVLFGQIVQKQGFATAAQVNKALRIQSLHDAMPRRPADENGPAAERPPRLGHIMVERGYIEPEQVVATLHKQTKAVLRCTECGVRYNIPGYEARRMYRCRRCGAVLGEVPSAESLSVEESGFLPPVSVPIPPPAAGGTMRIRKQPADGDRR